MFRNLKKKLSMFAFIGAFAFVIFVLLPQQQTNAIGGLPFGGVISFSMYCTCSNNYLVTVAGPVPGNLVFQPGASSLFAYAQVFRPGPFILGTYAQGSACLMYVVVGCVTLTTTGVITMAGTSL